MESGVLITHSKRLPKAGHDTLLSKTVGLVSDVTETVLLRSRAKIRDVLDYF